MRAWTPMCADKSVTKLHRALMAAHDDNVCLQLYTSRPKMSVYHSTLGYTGYIHYFLAIFVRIIHGFGRFWGMTFFLCVSWAFVKFSCLKYQTKLTSYCFLIISFYFGVRFFILTRGSCYCMPALTFVMLSFYVLPWTYVLLSVAVLCEYSFLCKNRALYFWVKIDGSWCWEQMTLYMEFTFWSSFAERTGTYFSEYLHSVNVRLNVGNSMVAQRLDLFT